MVVSTIVPNPALIAGPGAVGDFAWIGDLAGETGQVTVNGAGASWASNLTIYVGDFGTGTLNVRNGSVTTSDMRIGAKASGVGTTLVSGALARIDVLGGLSIGHLGAGALTVENGGTLTSAFAVIASDVGSTGTVTLTGAGTTWTNAVGTFFIGANGIGTLNILNGARMTNGTQAALGSISAAARGTVTVDGAGSVWDNSANSIFVGGAGSGVLRVSNGGAVTSTLGLIANGLGTGLVTVTGTGSSWTMTSQLIVGNAGNGTLEILAGGVVSNVGSAIGNSLGANGQATVDGAGSRWTTVGFLTLGQISGSAASLTLRNGGTAIADNVRLGFAAGTTGALNIGAASGAAAAAPGTLTAPTVTFGAGTGQIVFNHTAATYAFAPLISGAGSLLVEAGTTSLTANNTYTGSTTVNGGTLLVNGAIAASATTVNAGGTLGGSGIVGDTTISGGTLSPGNSIGTLTVQGNLILTAASTYLVEIGAAGADRTNVTGTATLGGARLVVVPTAGAVANQRHTILSADGGVSGSFVASVNNFNTTLSYDANNVYLQLQGALGNTTPLNQNQQAVASGINTAFNAGAALPAGFGNLFGLTGASLANSLTQLSGEAATGTQQTTFNAMDQFLNVMTDPFLGTRSGGVPQPGVAGYADDDETLAYAAKPKGRNPAEQDAYAAMVRKALPRAGFERRWSVWGAGYGGEQRTDGNATVGSNDVASRVYGGAAGFDYRLTPETLIGFSLGGAGTKYNLANGLGGGSSEMFQAGIYGRHHFGPGYIAGALAYAWQDVTTDRVALLNSYRANFDANALSGRLEAGWRYAFGASGLTPYAAGQFTTFFLPDYAEQVVAGTNVFALSYAEKDVTASRSELGLRADTSFAAQDAVVTLRGRAAWAHNFNTDRSISAIFQTLPAAAFVVNGAAQARDAALVSAGAEARWLNGFSVAATFEGEFSRVTDSYAGKGVLRYQW